jgi:hypothetical protein
MHTTLVWKLFECEEEVVMRKFGTQESPNLGLQLKRSTSEYDDRTMDKF